MKKKLLTVLLAGVLTMSMITACGGSKAADSSADAAKTEEKAEDTEEEEVEEEADAEEADAEEEDVEEADSADAGDGSFTLLDVDESMVDIGVYGTDTDGTELVFTMFTGPDGQNYVSLFAFDNESGSGDVICGTYEASTDTDEEGDNWTYFDVTDVYTGNSYKLGVGERPDTEEVVFFNEAGDVVQGQYLSAADTINYMGSAAALISQ